MSITFRFVWFMSRMQEVEMTWKSHDRMQCD